MSPRYEPQREWHFAILHDVSRARSKTAHLFVRSIAICNLNLVKGPGAHYSAKRCRNCKRMEKAEVFR